MGSILAETFEVERIEKLTKPLKDFFGAIFFVSVGMMVDMNVIVQFIWPILIISLVTMLGKLVLFLQASIFQVNRLKHLCSRVLVWLR
jgi:Kef-type K+ transport system membrane component KefB